MWRRKRFFSGRVEEPQAQPFELATEGLEVVAWAARLHARTCRAELADGRFDLPERRAIAA